MFVLNFLVLEKDVFYIDVVGIEVVELMLVLFEKLKLVILVVLIFVSFMKDCLLCFLLKIVFLYWINEWVKYLSYVDIFELEYFDVIVLL